MTKNLLIIVQQLITRLVHISHSGIRHTLHNMSSVLVWAKHGFCLSRQPTFDVNQVPVTFRTPDITRGYRPPHRPWTYYLTSLFQLHNETLNVWTHLIAAMYFTHRLVDICRSLDCLGDPASWPLLAFGISSLAYTLISAFSHLFSSMSETSYHCLSRLDYVGIGMNAQDSLMLWYFLAGNESFYRHFGQWYVVGSTIAGLTILTSCSMSFSRYPILPILACLAAALYGLIPLTYRIVDICLSGDIEADPLLWPQLFAFPLFGLSAFFFCSRIPERLKHGVFDILGNSHSLFHIAISSATMFQYDAALQEYKTRSEHLLLMADPSFLSAFGGQIIILVAGLLYTYLSHKDVNTTWTCQHIHHCMTELYKADICSHGDPLYLIHGKRE